MYSNSTKIGTSNKVNPAPVLGQLKVRSVEDLGTEMRVDIPAFFVRHQESWIGTSLQFFHAAPSNAGGRNDGWLSQSPGEHDDAEDEGVLKPDMGKDSFMMHHC